MTLPRIVQENRYAVIDCETTGVNINRDEIVQVAIAQIDNGRPAIRASTFVQPKRIISDEAIAKHGITWDVLQHAPPLTAVWPELRALISDRCLIGYNVSFDYKLLCRQLGENGIQFDAPALDVLAWERKFAGKGGKHNLVAAAERWGVPVLAHHEALADCRMCWNIFVQLASRFEELGNAVLADILSIRTVALPDNLAL